MSGVRQRASSAEHKITHRRMDEEKDIEAIYSFGKELGRGSFGVVIEGCHTDNREKWAIKIVNKEKAGRPSITLLEREVSILKTVNHDNIIHLEEIFETSRKMYLVMELCVHGDLKTIVWKKGPFSEISARHVMKQVTNAIVYLHKKGIVHRDLKLENILAATTQENDGDPLYDVKLTDFGLSVNKGGVGSESMLQASCGTPVYMAPEVIQNHDYSQMCDNWSLGIILYALLAKDFPFETDKGTDRLYELIKKGVVDFSKRIWNDISSGAKELIKKLLDVNPAHRCTANEVTLHHWMTGDPNKSIPSSVLVMMKRFAENPDLEDEENDENLPANELTPNNNTDTGRPGSSEAHSSGSSDLPPPPINKVKKTPTKTANNNSTLNSRGATGFNNTTKVGQQRKNFGSPRKIYDNKSFPNRQQHSPTHSTTSRVRSAARSPIPNGNNNRLSANMNNNDHRRSTSPGGHHRAASPKPPSSPLLTPRNATSADVRLNSANRTRKKKTSLSATMPKR